MVIFALVSIPITMLVNQRPMCTTHGRVMWATHMRVGCAKMVEEIVS